MHSPPDHGIVPATAASSGNTQSLIADSSPTTSNDNLSGNSRLGQFERETKAASDSEPEMVNVKLSPSLKHLLSLRNPLPQPAPSAEALNKVFAQTLGDLRVSSQSRIQRNSGDDGEGVLKSWVTVAVR